MKITNKRVIASVAALALLCGATTVFAANVSGQSGTTSASAATASASASAASSASASSSDSASASSDDPLSLGDVDLEKYIDTSETGDRETIYIVSGFDGSAQNIIVGTRAADTGVSTLDRTGGWSDSDLPVGVKLTYTLDGKEISADELAGKSGHVTISFDYEPRAKATVKVGDAEKELYVPFTMLSGVLLDNDKFSNVTIDNGRVLDDGDRSIALGIAFPGLQSDLDIATDKFELPQSVTIEADTTDFSLLTSLTVATNSVVNSINTDDLTLGDTDNLANQLRDAMSSLTDGAGKLYDGTAELFDKCGELSDGVASLRSGADTLAGYVPQLESGASNLAKGASNVSDGVKQVRSYLNELTSGLETLDSSSAALVSGAEKVFDTLLSTADSALKDAGIDAPALTMDNYQTVLDGVSANLSADSVKKLATETARSTVSEKVEANRSAVEEAVLKTLGMTPDQYKAADAAGKIDDATKAKFKAAVDAQIDQLIEQNMQSDEVQAQISAAVTKAQSGGGAIASLKAQLDSYSEFYQGVVFYTAGVKSAYTGSQKISSGLKTLGDGGASLAAGAITLRDKLSEFTSGVTELASGVDTLDDSTGALTDGVASLRDGAKELRDGIDKFDTDAVQKLLDTLDGDLGGLADRLRATVDASESYRSFPSGSADGSVIFIWRSAEIGSN